MEVKTEPVDQSYETTSISIMKMNEKFAKLQQEFVRMKKEMAELRKENAEMKEEMARNGEKCKRQNAMLKEMMAILKIQNHRELEMQQQQSQMSIMDNPPNNTNDNPIERAQNEFVETLMMTDELDQREQQNVENNDFDFVENLAATIIKQEYGNAETGTNFPIQMQTTSSSNLNNYEEEENGDNQQNELYEFFAGIEGLQNIECAPIKIGGMLKCNWPGCEFRSLYPYNMQTHWRTHTGERPFVCEECGQSFSHSSTLKRHSLIHTGQKPYQCNVCGKSFRKSSQLSIHVRNHTGEKAFLCTECDKSFKSNTGLQKHRQIHHGKQFT